MSVAFDFDFRRVRLYYPPPMHAGLPDFVVVARAAANARVFSGKLPVSALRRLSDRLLDTGGFIDTWCRFRRDEQGRAIFRLRLDGALFLECQRCGEGFYWPLSRELDFQVVTSEAKASRITDEVVEPCIAQDGRVDLLATIEDEIILSLPIVSRHGNEAACASQAPVAQELDQGRDEESPFAVLKRIEAPKGD